MTRLTMQTDHALGRAEAARRLKEKFASVFSSYQSQVSELRERWDDHVLSFGFKAVGMTIAGTVTVDEGDVKLEAQLPLAAAMFKGLIEQQIRKELGDLLT